MCLLGPAPGFFYGGHVKVASLEIELIANIARLRSDLDRAAGVTNRSMAQITRTVQRAMQMVSAALAGAGTGFAAWAMSMSKSMDATLKMSQQIGTTTEAL